MKNNMGFTVINKISLLFLLISAAALLSTSFAGRVYKPLELKDVSSTHEARSYFLRVFVDHSIISLEHITLDYNIENNIQEEMEPLIRHGEEGEIHERLLQVKTNDYGRYDPAPALVKPPFKLIPN